MIVDTIAHAQQPWRSIGEFFCSRQVHRDVGGPLFSQPGTVWFVAINGGGRDVLGFCSLSDRGTAVWYDCAYVRPAYRGAGVFAELGATRDAFASLIGKPIKTSVKPERWHRYAERGFAREYERDGWVYGVRA